MPSHGFDWDGALGPPMSAESAGAESASMAAVQSQTIDRSALGAATRETHEDPGAMGFMCLDLGCGKQTLFFQEEVAPPPNQFWLGIAV